ncbi:MULTISPECIES: hypothetical protein [Nostoc]|uniref:Uncharacterized protein n=1 Tax=Nostoc paludosum FACHB-159 TaxID=2692908 RepID=A0ABR8K8C1_9NOSO|nr:MULTISPECIES: hypothetical protein [Nostoc]MBD2734979.1 hypothetical protein [Nostoc paludosum FACHB-159]
MGYGALGMGQPGSVGGLGIWARNLSPHTPIPPAPSSATPPIEKFF